MKKFRIFLFTFLVLYSSVVYSQVPASSIRIDSLPESEIDIPISVNLLPVYRFANGQVDTAFTSPNYPKDWVQVDCATRYKYHFRRSPLQMNMKGATLNLGFTGFYQIIGSTRACVNGAVLSPWTPGCRCGFDEPERRVNISFSASFRLLPNLVLATTITRNEPQALDKCAVCFWGQDVTPSVLAGLKAELDSSQKKMQNLFGAYSLRPWLQKAWNLMNEVYAIPGVGYFSLHPKKLRMEKINAADDKLNINIGISASPVVSFVKTSAESATVPDLSTGSGNPGFNINLEAILQYDSLSKVINGYMSGKEFDVADGIFKKHIVIKSASVGAGENGLLKVLVDFTGSFNGRAIFTGTPVYNSAGKMLDIQNLEYDIQTKNLLLKTARWLFNKRILAELNKFTSFDLAPYYTTATATMNDWLNREWTKGIRGNGQVSEIGLTSMYVLPDQLLIRSSCKGMLSITINELSLMP